MAISRNSVCALVLPLLGGLAAFSSKTRSPDYELTQFLSWSLFIVLGVIFVTNFKYKQVAIPLFMMAAVVKALLLGWPDASNLVVLSNALYVVITVFAGACVLLVRPILLLRQMYWLSLVSIIMSLLQLNGVLWAQEFGSAADWKVVGDAPVLFQPYSPDGWIAMSQTRPDGFTHANNLTSQLLVFFYAYAFFHYAFQTNQRNPPLRWLFAIAFACALNAGKVVVLGILTINVVAWLFLRNKASRGFARPFAVTVAAYLAYFLLFPAVFMTNLNFDVFIFNAMGRVLNLQEITGLAVLGPVFELFSGIYSGQHSEIDNPEQVLRDVVTTEAFSGIASVVDQLIWIVPGGMVIGFLLARRLRRLDHLQMRSMRYFVIIMLIALICSVFGGPFITTVWFSFFLSFALVPLTLPYLARHFRQAVLESPDIAPGRSSSRA